MSEMGIELIVEAFAVVVIGGLGSMRGAFVGALVVGVLRAVAIAVYPELEMLLIYLDRDRRAASCARAGSSAGRRVMARLVLGAGRGGRCSSLPLVAPRLPRHC